MDTLHVVTAIANPIRWQGRAQLYHQYEEHMPDSGVHLTVVECAYGDRPHEFADNLRITHVPVRAHSVLWIKENLLTIGLGRLPQDWRNVAWIDADVTFRRPDWAMETVHALQQYDVVQPSSDCYDLGPNDKHLQVHRSFCRLACDDAPIASNSCTFAHPGYAWAATRRSLRTRREITASRRLLVGRYRVVPLTVKFVTSDVDCGHFLVGDFDACGVEIAAHLETGFGGGRCDQLHDYLVTDQRLGAPVLGDGCKQPMLASRPGESHPQALLEPYVKLSLHTAPDAQPPTDGVERPYLVPGLLPSPVGPGPRLSNAAPSVQSHCRTFNPTTSRSAPVPRIGTQALAVFATWASPLTSGRQVLTFHTRAWSGFAPPICRMPLRQASGPPPS